MNILLLYSQLYPIYRFKCWKYGCRWAVAAAIVDSAKLRTSTISLYKIYECKCGPDLWNFRFACMRCDSNAPDWEIWRTVGGGDMLMHALIDWILLHLRHIVGDFMCIYSITMHCKWQFMARYKWLNSFSPLFLLCFIIPSYKCNYPAQDRHLIALCNFGSLYTHFMSASSIRKMKWERKTEKFSSRLIESQQNYMHAQSI